MRMTLVISELKAIATAMVDKTTMRVLERMTLNAKSTTDHASDKVAKMKTWEYIQ
jgi:hypothetical protein